MYDIINVYNMFELFVGKLNMLCLVGCGVVGAKYA